MTPTEDELANLHRMKKSIETYLDNNPSAPDHMRDPMLKELRRIKNHIKNLEDARS